MVKNDKEIDKIEWFLKRKERVKGTKTAYRRMIKRFFDFLEVKNYNEYLVDMRLITNNGDKVELMDKRELDVINFKEYLINGATTKEKLLAQPKTILLYLTAIKGLFDANNCELGASVWKNIMILPKNLRGITTENLIPDRRDLKHILYDASPKAEALFLTLASSGCRIGELLQVTLDHVFLDEKPARIHLKREWTKTDSERDVFLSDEAKVKLKHWVGIRDKYVDSVNRRLKDNSYVNTIKSGNKELFPFQPSTARIMWTTLLQRANHLYPEKQYLRKDSITNRYIFHIHQLRKFYRRHSSMNQDAKEQLLGHEGYLGQYNRWSLDQLRKEYVDHMPSVTIMASAVPSGVDIDKIKEEVRAEYKETNQWFEFELDKLRKEIEDFKK